MALDNAEWVDELSPINPLPTDSVGQGDYHIRTIKTVIDNTFVGEVGVDIYDSIGGPILVGPAAMNLLPSRVTALEGEIHNDFASPPQLGNVTPNTIAGTTGDFSGDVNLGGDVELTDGAKFTWGGDQILRFNGSSTQIGDATSNSVLRLSGGISTFSGDVDVAGQGRFFGDVLGTPSTFGVTLGTQAGGTFGAIEISGSAGGFIDFNLADSVDHHYRIL